jgi:uncharacterized protein YbjT (DUF2867 family)
VFDSQGSNQCSVARFLQGRGGSNGLATSQAEWRKHLAHAKTTGGSKASVERGKAQSNKKGRQNMKIVVIGGSGLIGSRVVQRLAAQGHQALTASPNTGVNSVTGEGLAEALKGASVVVDVSNSPSWEDAAVMKFFETSTRNLLTYEASARVGHHVALSVVGTDRLSESGYFRAKIAQEKLINESSIPYSIVHATQFFEFLKGLADVSMDGAKVYLPPVLFQPMAADDVASGVATIAVGPPVNGIVEIGGPEQFRVDELVRRRLAALKDPREVIADPDARYDGAEVGNVRPWSDVKKDCWISNLAIELNCPMKTPLQRQFVQQSAVC